MFARWLNIGTKKSSLLIGPRRVGKTTLLKTRFPAYKYTTLDDLDYLDWAKKDPIGFIKELGDKALIDEIQRLPELTIAVKYAIDNLGANIIMTGSSVLGLLDNSADTLAGRINIYSLPTACWGEIYGKPTHKIFTEKINPKEIKEVYRLVSDGLTFGHFPEVLTQATNDDKVELLANYRNTYFTRDLMQLSNIENIEGLLSIFNNIARSIGSHLEISNFAREAGLSFQSAKKYLNILHQSQLTFKLYGYQYGPAKRFIKAAKTYYSDNGIICSLKVQLNEGQLLENFVISELEKRRKLGFIDVDQFYYYKSSAGREIDLVFETGHYIYGIEIKANKRVSARDIKNLKEFGRQINRPAKLFLFYMGEEYAVVDNINIIPVAALYRGN